jgi:archaellum component FlaC
MDVWTLGEKYKQSNAEIQKIKERVKHIEEYLSNSTKDNNERVPSKQVSAPSVRTSKRTTRKSKSSK